MSTYKTRNDSGIIVFWCIVLAFLLVFLCGVFGGVCHAGQIEEGQAVSCIIGEAESEGPDGMSAIAHALRNRGNIRGVYGCSSARVRLRLYSSKTFVQAVKAWEESRSGQDTTLGATGWGNNADIKHFSRLKWWKKCLVTVKIKNHTFYRERK